MTTAIRLVFKKEKNISEKQKFGKCIFDLFALPEVPNFCTRENLFGLKNKRWVSDNSLTVVTDNGYSDRTTVTAVIILIYARIQEDPDQ